MAADGGWGWMVVLGSFICHFFLAGVIRSMGIVYVQLQERFEASATDTALAASVFVCLCLFGGTSPNSLGLLVSCLLQRCIKKLKTKFCTVIKTTECISSVVRILASQIQDGGWPPSWKNRQITISQRIQDLGRGRFVGVSAGGSPPLSSKGKAPVEGL